MEVGHVWLSEDQVCGIEAASDDCGTERFWAATDQTANTDKARMWWDDMMKVWSEPSRRGVTKKLTFLPTALLAVTGVCSAALPVNQEQVEGERRGLSTSGMVEYLKGTYGGTMSDVISVPGTSVHGREWISLAHLRQSPLFGSLCMSFASDCMSFTSDSVSAPVF